MRRTASSDHKIEGAEFILSKPGACREEEGAQPKQEKEGLGDEGDACYCRRGEDPKEGASEDRCSISVPKVPFGAAVL